MAPRKRGGGGRGGSFIFCCFQSNDHPEITYRLREDFVLQTMEPTLPIPSYDELDCMFSELVVSVSMQPRTYLHSYNYDLITTLLLLVFFFSTILYVFISVPDYIVVKISLKAFLPM